MRIGGIVNVNSNHWVAVIVDLWSSTVLYGDSLGGSDGDVVAALSWWAGFHMGRQFSQAALPIGIQTNTISCGLFAKVGLMHEPETSRDIQLLFTKNLMAPSILLK